MSSQLFKIRRSLRGPLLMLVSVLTAVVLIELGLLAKLGWQITESGRQLDLATAEQMAALEMEISTREQDMALFRHLQTGDPIHIEHLADSWINFAAVLADYRRSLASQPPAIQWSGRNWATQLAELEAEAETHAGVLVNLREHKTLGFSNLQTRIDRTIALLREIDRTEAATGIEWQRLIRSIEFDINGALLGVSGHLATPGEPMRTQFEHSCRDLMVHIGRLRMLSQTDEGRAIIAQLESNLGEVQSLGESVISTRDDESLRFAAYSATLRTISEDVLRDGLRAQTAQRQAIARMQLDEQVRSTLLNGLILGGLAAAVGLIGGWWLYRQAIGAHLFAERFQSLIDNAPFSVWLFNREGRVAYANPAALNLFGVTDPNSVVGRLSVRDISSEEGRVIHPLFKRALAGDVVMGQQSLDLSKVSFASVRRDMIRVDTTLFPISRGADVEPGIVMIQEDITERVRAEEAKAEAERAIEHQRSLTMRSDRLRSLGEMAAGIAHELNQPLVGVRGLAEHILLALRRKWDVSEEMIREKSSLIVEQADRMEHIVDHVRMFAREAGKPDLKQISVNDVVKSCKSLLGEQLRARGIALELSLSDDLPPIIANPFSLEEVIINMISNSRDSIEERMRDEGNLHPPHLVISTEANDSGGVSIRVRDFGCGIPSDVIERVFDPFFSTKGPDRGTGLGLSIAKGIIEEFGGEIEIQSTPGKGTVTVITVPAATGIGEESA